MKDREVTSDDISGVRDFTRRLADDLVRAGDGAIVGVYLHGSAVFGDWNAAASDVDVLVVVVDEVESEVCDQLAGVLSAERACPGAGLEASVVAAAAAAQPAGPWPFIVHATTAAHDRKTVWGGEVPGDDDLVLHYVATRTSGWAAYGPDPTTVVGAISDDIVVGQLARDLRWALDHASESYAVLNACRALRFRDEGTACSKTEGGEWALAREIQPALVRRALDARRAGGATPTAPDAAAWVSAVADALGENRGPGTVSGS